MYNYRTTVRMNNNLQKRIQLLAAQNVTSFNKMVNCLLEMGYQQFLNRYNSNYENKRFNLGGMRNNDK